MNMILKKDSLQGRNLSISIQDSKMPQIYFSWKSPGKWVLMSLNGELPQSSSKSCS